MQSFFIDYLFTHYKWLPVLEAQSMYQVRNIHTAVAYPGLNQPQKARPKSQLLAKNASQLSKTLNS